MLFIFLNLFNLHQMDIQYIVKNPNENANHNYVSYLFNLYNHGE